MSRREQNPNDQFFAIKALCTVLAGVGWVGCAADQGGALDPSETDGTAASANQLVNGARLYTLELGAGHKLEFWEFADERFGVRELMPIGKTSVSDLVPREQWTMSAVFRQAAPDAREVPQVLVDADLRSAQAAQRPRIDRPEGVISKQKDDVSELNEVLPTEQLGAAAACTADYYGDNWGAQWFLDNFCKGGDGRWCKTNRTSGYTGVVETDWFRWSVMAADFANGARITGGKQKVACTDGNSHCWYYDDVVYEENMEPRTVLTWTITGWDYYEGWASAPSSCRRVHYANIWE